ncbi:hypothetical protein SDC9_128964 [bioreactor metagenome]|uniref:Uncharacterized protein n=1 Tax=bioreactor metagenome TaxID=1076179 RepID=A0A645CYD3_9ZZZZ
MMLTSFVILCRSNGRDKQVQTLFVSASLADGVEKVRDAIMTLGRSQATKDCLYPSLPTFLIVTIYQDTPHPLPDGCMIACYILGASTAHKIIRRNNHYGKRTYHNYLPRHTHL